MSSLLLSVSGKIIFSVFLVSLRPCSSGVGPSGVHDNDIWSSLLVRCAKDTSYRCVQDSVSSYLDRTLESDFVTDTVSFRYNNNNYTDMCSRTGTDDFDERTPRDLENDSGFSEFVKNVEDVEDMAENNYRRGRDFEARENNASLKWNDAKSIHDVTDILYDRGVRYLMTHDLDIYLPSAIYGEGRVKISPRGFDEDGGALVKINVMPDQPQEGRLFLKQIQKLFKKKLMTSMMAAVLIIKLLKLKMMFFLPLLLGVGTAKKILLKVLLFIFPALAHLFKLCSYYHHKHAKYHHHHHQVAHHHHHIPVPVYSAPGELPAPYPAASYDVTGPGVYSHSRNEVPGTLTDLASWGLGDYPASWDAPAGTEPPRYAYPTRAQQVASTMAYPSQVEAQRYTPSRLQTPRPASGYDPFYSPILVRLEAVFNQIGVTDEGCRERLVCSMYKNPTKYSPHSNLVSAELSREPTELQRPQLVSMAAVRFFRYMAAARDGQELKDCLRLYPVCTLATE